ncbi:1-acyl-sn-glycerol-3-phosphate acyltransferase 2-like [Malania oleifera]|uniref:1-acyl-sn-glycerol-3-phosphate acyltransferase 2-like n=1 Tax=Malania oleifera TaxID=397392 RepID=UPI0025AE1932|nr:1-acyl-sn-glycerol-3-phosphate acyltransferase 2-like [Malania oleifera]
MEISAALIAVPLGVLFILTGLIVNLLQAIFFILVYPLSKRVYRRINKLLMELLCSEFMWLFDWWAGVKVQLYTDSETFQIMGKEHAIVICNHRSDIDWLVGWVLAERSGCLGSAVALMKKSIKFLPVIGWAMWFSDYIFLERSWAKDESSLKSGFQQLEDFSMPFWLAIFPEGTRFTQAKLQAAQEYAVSAGLPVPRNTLIPRTKGLVSAVNNLRSFVPAIYNTTVAVPKDEPSPTMLRILKGKPSVVHVHIERVLMQELPETDVGIAQWCKDVFVAKDALLDEHRVKDTFVHQKCQDISRPKKSLLIFLSWSCLLIFGIVKFLQWSSLLSSWKGLASSGAFLALVTITMHIFILFSQSEHSTPARTSTSDSMKESLLPK